MSEQSMVEKVAADLEEEANRISSLGDFENGPDRKQRWALLARAAIAAMREEDLRSVLALRKFEKLYEVAEDGCWAWQGAIDKRDGYGRFYNGDGSTISAHQFAFMTAHGDIPAGMVIDHICRNRSCVNPDHLRLLSNAENVLCGVGITAQNLAKDACRNGHALYGDNLYVRPNGERDCKECRREANRRFKRKRRLDAALKED